MSKYERFFFIKENGDHRIMDSLTQIVLGAAVGEAVLGKKVGNKALLYGAVAGTIPDLDVLARFFTDTVSTLEIHRGFSHSIFFSILFAPVFGFLISRWERKHNTSWKDWSWLMFWGLLTHPILDAFTTWGTQLFWPFDLRLAFKNIFVIDPLYTLPFLICVVLVLFQKRIAPKRRKLNNTGLIMSTAYLMGTLILKGISYQKFVTTLENQKVAYTDLQTRPAPFNAILWTANVETEDAYLIGDYSFFDTQPIQFKRYPKNHQLLGALDKEDKVQRLIKISEGWYTIEEKEGNIFFNDLRFGLTSVDASSSQFVFSYQLIPSTEGLMVSEAPKFGTTDAKSLLAALWERIWGN